MKSIEIKTYRDRETAKRATCKRSIFAALNGQCSQYEVREFMGTFVGGYQGDLAREYPNGRIVKQYAGGYSV